MGTKITLATFKSFVKNNRAKLLIKHYSSFNGMSDCVEHVKDEFKPAKSKENPTEYKDNYTLGVCGVWLVGGSRDYFTKFENDKLTGIEVSNSCGSYIVAISKF